MKLKEIYSLSTSHQSSEIHSITHVCEVAKSNWKLSIREAGSSSKPG